MHFHCPLPALEISLALLLLIKFLSCSALYQNAMNIEHFDRLFQWLLRCYEFVYAFGCDVLCHIQSLNLCRGLEPNITASFIQCIVVHSNVNIIHF